MENINIPEDVKLFYKVQDLKKFLKDTDWYYARKAETGEEVPTEVIAKRAEAREFIRANEGVSDGL